MARRIVPGRGDRRLTARRAATAVALALVAAGCGSSRGGHALPQLTVALDFTPNAVHAPIYAAVRDGLDRRAGVRLRIRTPGASPDSLKDVLTGAADLGILDIQDLGLAVGKGRDVVAVAALVERPLAAIVALPSIRRPRDLEGRSVGVSGLPSDPAVLRAVLRHDGGDLRRVHQITIGFAAVQNLISHRVDAVPAFWNVEGVTLRRRGVAVREFRVDDYGAPRFPEVVLVCRRGLLRTRPRAVRAAVAAVAAGMRDVRARPGAAAAEIARASGTPAGLVRAEITAVAPIMGTRLRRPVLVAWARWAARFGILPHAPPVDRAFAP